MSSYQSGNWWDARRFAADDMQSVEDAWPLRKRVSLAGKTPAVIQYLGLQSLIQNKKASGRVKDLDDLEHLKDL